MKTTILLAALLAVACTPLSAAEKSEPASSGPHSVEKAAAATATQADSVPAGQRDLLASGNLSDWVEEQHVFYKAKHPGVQTWSLKDGVLMCSGLYGNCGFLRYREKLADFHLSLEYRTAPRCNSGVCIRCRVPYTTLKPNTLPSHVGFEVQIFDDSGKPADIHSSGAFYGVLAPKLSAARPAGQWNTLEITCVGPKIRVLLNGQTVQDVDQTQVPSMADRGLEGYLSLQNHGGKAEFRKVLLQILKPASSTPQKAL
jgi:hypothetical protein